MIKEQYTLRGREIFSARGKLVATLDDDGNPVMAPGMAGPHSRGVREFLARENDTAKPPEAPEAETPAAPEIETPEAEEGGTTVYVGRIPAAPASGGAPAAPRTTTGTVEEYSIATIPDDELPPFSKEYGSDTPGFREFCDKHKLTPPQVAALVRRLERK